MKTEDLKVTTEAEAEEMLGSAKINFENFERMNPGALKQLSYKIAKMQLDCAEKFYTQLHDDSDGD